MIHLLIWWFSGSLTDGFIIEVETKWSTFCGHPFTNSVIFLNAIPSVQCRLTIHYPKTSCGTQATPATIHHYFTESHTAINTTYIRLYVALCYPLNSMQAYYLLSQDTLAENVESHTAINTESLAVVVLVQGSCQRNIEDPYVQHQPIIWNDIGLLLTGPLRTNFNAVWFKTLHLHIKMNWKISCRMATIDVNWHRATLTGTTAICDKIYFVWILKVAFMFKSVEKNWLNLTYLGREMH